MALIVDTNFILPGLPPAFTAYLPTANDAVSVPSGGPCTLTGDGDFAGPSTKSAAAILQPIGLEPFDVYYQSSVQPNNGCQGGLIVTNGVTGPSLTQWVVAGRYRFAGATDNYLGTQAATWLEDAGNAAAIYWRLRRTGSPGAWTYATYNAVSEPLNDAGWSLLHTQAGETDALNFVGMYSAKWSAEGSNVWAQQIRFFRNWPAAPQPGLELAFNA